MFGPFGGSADARVPGLHEMAKDFNASPHCHGLEVGRVAAQCQLSEEDIVPLAQRQLLPLGSAGVIEVSKMTEHCRPATHPRRPAPRHDISAPPTR